MRILVFKHGKITETETFIKDHVERLGDNVSFYGGYALPRYEFEGKALSPHLDLARKVIRHIDPRPKQHRRISSCVRLLRQHKPDVVLAEFGLSGIQIVEACKIEKIPLVVHFHGYEISKKKIINENKEKYKELFKGSYAIVAVSRLMKERLINLGAKSEKVVVNPCGVDTDFFAPGDVANSNKVFLSIGRFVEKKGPHLTVLAFAKAFERDKEIRLFMIGDGPLRPFVNDLIISLKLTHAVKILGFRSRKDISMLMQNARAYLQHSVEAEDGDREGTPVSVLEAQSAALPVVATRHEGIKDAVVDGKTGFLVEERDVESMSNYILELAVDSKLASLMGAAGRERVISYFSMEKSIGRLKSVLQAAHDDLPVPCWDESFGKC